MQRAKLIYLLLLPFLLNACGTHSESREVLDAKNAQNNYLNLRNQESKRKEQFNRIFYGVYFKMTADSFYKHCNKMFKERIFTGGYDYQVRVQLKEPFSRPVTLKFYPAFEKSSISKIDCRFTYTGANVFNKADRADMLMKEVVAVMMEWYRGNEFIEMPSGHPLKGPGYVKVDANRKITLSESDNGMDVEVIYQDLKTLY